MTCVRFVTFAAKAVLFGLLMVHFGGQARAADVDSSVVVLPLLGQSYTRVEGEQAMAALKRGLGASGLKARDVKSVSLSEKLKGCYTNACASAIVKETGSRYVVSLALWFNGGGGLNASSKEGTVEVLISDAEANTYEASAKVEGSIDTVVREALAQALTKTRLGAGPWLEVSGEPKGASVVLDGLSVGTVPYVGKVSAGVHKVLVQGPTGKALHEFEVTNDVHETYELIVDVRAANGTVRLERTSERDAALRRSKMSAPVLPEESASSTVLSNPLWWTLAAVGVAGVAIGTYGLVQGNACDFTSSTGACLKEKEPNTGVSLIYAGAGVAAIGSAVIWYLLDNNKTSSRHANTDAPQLLVMPNGLGVKGRF